MIEKVGVKMMHHYGMLVLRERIIILDLQTIATARLILPKFMHLSKFQVIIDESESKLYLQLIFFQA